ncbi:MAG: type III pantothenate kinase [Bacteroidetes bacterium]|nr:type III pantothenate kinase [Bacteroidota bacterium]
MNLCIDIGNSLIKTAIFDCSEIIETIVNKTISVSFFSRLKSKYSIDRVILSSVRKANTKMTGELQKLFPDFLELNNDTPLPFENCYKTPDTLGRDRLAAIAGAGNIFPGSHVLVIDAGTAITYDLITAGKKYLGGNISPGLNMRFRALNRFTDNLPFVSPKTGFEMIGRDTEEAISIGVLQGIFFEMEQYIRKFSDNYPGLKVILTGGDAHFFEKELKNDIFVVANLILLGLNSILKYNVKKS